MPRTIIKLRLHSNKHKPKIKQQVINKTKSTLPPKLQSSNRNYYQEMALLIWLRRFSIIR